MPLISVIVPVYKVEKYLTRCIDSIVNQTFKDFELILVDDGSPDQCPAICDRYAEKFDFIVSLHKKNGGQSSARNCGIEYMLKYSDAKYVTFIDSDDWVHLQYLEILYENLIKSNVNVCCCSFKRTSNHSEQEDRIAEYNIYRDSAESLWCRRIISISVAWAKLYNRELFTENRYPEGAIYEDMRTTPKILMPLDSVIAVDSQIYFYFTREDSTMNSVVSKKNYDDSFVCFKEMICYFRDNGYYDAMHYWFQVYFRWQFFERSKNLSYVKYVNRHRRFLLHLLNDFQVDQYEDEYKKVFGDFGFIILFKLQRFLSNIMR